MTYFKLLFEFTHAVWTAEIVAVRSFLDVT